MTTGPFGLDVEIPDVPILHAKGKPSCGLYHQDWNYVNVKTGDTLATANGIH